MLVAAAVCPHPPLLVPGVAAGATGELDDLRAACDAAVSAALEVEHDLLVVVGLAPSVGPFPAGAWGSLRPYGVALDVGTGAAAATLPLSLTVGRWLLDRAKMSRDAPADRGSVAVADRGSAGGSDALLFGVTEDASPQRCADLGAVLAERAGRVAMLVMGDGSARRSAKGPGYLDERAEPFDTAVEAALRAADLDALATLDADLAAELLVAGRAPWQVLTGAARRTAEASDPTGEDAPWQAEVTYAAAPYGVTYLTATWLPPSSK